MALGDGRRSLAGIAHAGLSVWAAAGVAEQSDAATAASFAAIAFGLLLAYAALAASR